LCAVTADAFVRGRVQLFGNKVEGFIVVPVGWGFMVLVDWGICQTCV